MGQPTVVTINGVGTSQWFIVNRHITPFNIGFGVTVDATATYTIQHTFEDPNNPEGTTPTRIFNHDTLAGVSASADGNYAFPVAAIRIDVTASSGDVTFEFMQAGVRN